MFCFAFVYDQIPPDPPQNLFADVLVGAMPRELPDSEGGPGGFASRQILKISQKNTKVAKLKSMVFASHSHANMQNTLYLMHVLRGVSKNSFDVMLMNSPSFRKMSKRRCAPAALRAGTFCSNFVNS